MVLIASAAQGRVATADNVVVSLRPIVAWVPKGQTSRLPASVPIRELPRNEDETAGPRYVKALAWGAGKDLWFAFDSGIGRIDDARTSPTWTWYVLPRPDGEDRDTEPEVLAPRGPKGRIAVGTVFGSIAVSDGVDPKGLKLHPMQSSEQTAGIMPWVGWSASGSIGASVHLSCNVAMLDAKSGADVWRREERVARYPATSFDGRWLLLPWAEADSDAEVLDADTGKTLARLPRKGADRVYGAIDDMGRFVVQGRDDEHLSVWEWKSGAVSKMEMESGERPIAMGFVPATSRCVVASPQAISLFDVATGRRMCRWEAKDAGPLGEYVPQSDMSVSADGRLVAVLTEHLTVVVLEIVTEKPR